MQKEYSICERVKYILDNEPNITITAMAGYLQCSRQHLYDLLNGKKEFSFDSLMKICEVTKYYTPHWLCFGFPFPKNIPKDREECISFNVNLINYQPVFEKEKEKENYCRKICQCNIQIIKQFEDLKIDYDFIDTLDTTYYADELPAEDICYKKIVDNNNEIELGINFSKIRNGPSLHFAEKKNLSNLKFLLSHWEYNGLINKEDFLLIKASTNNFFLNNTSSQFYLLKELFFQKNNLLFKSELNFGLHLIIINNTVLAGIIVYNCILKRFLFIYEDGKRLSLKYDFNSHYCYEDEGLKKFQHNIKNFITDDPNYLITCVENYTIIGKVIKIEREVSSLTNRNL